MTSQSSTSTLEAASTLPLEQLSPEEFPDATVLADLSAPQLLNSAEEFTSLQHQPHESQNSQPGQNRRKAELQIFLSTFLTIFFAELGDKTQVTTLLMSAESHAPWVVFAGSATALVATSLIGVWLGCWLAKRVPARTLETSAGALLLLVSGLLLWDVIQL